MDAFNKAKKTRIFNAESFADSLYQKAKFLEESFQLGSEWQSMELIPLLKNIDEKCESVFETLKNK